MMYFRDIDRCVELCHRCTHYQLTYEYNSLTKARNSNSKKMLDKRLTG